LTELDVEVIGMAAVPADELRTLVAAALARAGISDGHVAVSFVEPHVMAGLNEEHRGKQGPTDVLSFPIDGTDVVAAGPRELGDIVICPQHTADLREAVVHGALHLVGYDHEVDDGEMLRVQAEVLAATRGRPLSAESRERPPT
jgi:probable rRNA maturation factor